MRLQCDVWRDLVPFVQFKKHEKHQWRSATFRKVAGFWPAILLKVALLHGCFYVFLNRTNIAKSRKAFHMKLLAFPFMLPKRSKYLNYLTYMKSINIIKWCKLSLTVNACIFKLRLCYLILIISLLIIKANWPN